MNRRADAVASRAEVNDHEIGLLFAALDGDGSGDVELQELLEYLQKGSLFLSGMTLSWKQPVNLCKCNCC